MRPNIVDNPSRVNREAADPTRTPRPETAAKLKRWLKFVLPSKGLVEVRAVEIPRRSGKPGTSVSFISCSKLDVIADRMVRLSNSGAAAVYWTLNPLVRSREGDDGIATSDKAVACRRLLLVDLDPKRAVKDTSASDAEKAAARAKAEAVRGHLRSLGWPDPVFADSGNGYHLVYLIELPNDDAAKELVKAVLAALAARFDDAAVQVDTSNFNASRICKAWGTVARKGTPTAERPHRAGSVVELPDSFVVVPRDKLEALAAKPEPKPRASAAKVVPGSKGDPVRTYALKALEEECNAVASAAEGQRNQTLNRAAFSLGTLVQPGALWENEVIEALVAAALQAGPNEAKIRNTITRGVRKGMEKPRDLSDVGQKSRTNGYHHTNGTIGGGGFVGFVGTPPPTRPDFPSDPKPIVSVLRPVPAFDPKLLPAPIRPWIADIADRMQCAPEYPAVGAIVSIATLVGRKVSIRPKQKDSWSVVPNLWGMFVGRPGVLKTPAADEAMGPLNRLAAEAIKEHAARVADFNRNLMIASARREAAKEQLRSAAKKKASDGELMDLAEAATATDTVVEPSMKRYITNDPTVEKAGELLRDNDQGMMIHRDELMGFLKSLDKQGHESDRAFYLESWNGNGSFTHDRIGRGTIFIKSLCLSVLGGIQPGPLASYIRAATSEGGDDGLISRFQLAVYPDQGREFKVVDRYPNAPARDAAFEVFGALDTLDVAAMGAITDDFCTIPYLRFSEEAQQFFYGWLADLEAKVRGGESPAMESHLSKYRSLMPSLALLFHLVDAVAAKTNGPISLPAAERAAAWCDFLEAHARRIYEFGSNGDVGPARNLAEKLAESLPEPFTARDVVRKGWAGLGKTEDVEQAFGVLEDHGWIVGVEYPADPNKGGRPTVKYHRNPKITSKKEPEGAEASR